MVIKTELRPSVFRAIIFELVFELGFFLESELFSNLGNWISNRLHFSNASIIFYLNILGFLASLYVQASTALPNDVFHNRVGLIIAVVLLRAGFSSFVSLSLI